MSPMASEEYAMVRTLQEALTKAEDRAHEAEARLADAEADRRASDELLGESEAMRVTLRRELDEALGALREIAEECQCGVAHHFTNEDGDRLDYSVKMGCNAASIARSILSKHATEEGDIRDE